MLGSLDLEELQYVMRLLHRRNYPKGEVIFHKDDPGDSLYLIVHGAVKIHLITPTGTERTLSILQSGEFFGEMALLDESPRSATAETLDDAELLSLQKRDFTSLLMNYPAISLKVIRVLCARLRRMNAQVEAFGSRDASSRIIGVLIELADQNGQDTATGRRIELLLTHQEVANLASTSRETVTRVLCGLQDDGMLKIESRHLVITDPKSLSERLAASPDSA